MMSTEIEHLTALAAELREAHRQPRHEEHLDLALARLDLALNEAATVLLSVSDFCLTCGVLGMETTAVYEALGASSNMLEQFSIDARNVGRDRVSTTWLSTAFENLEAELRALCGTIGPTPHPDGAHALRHRAEGIARMLSAYTRA